LGIPEGTLPLTPIENVYHVLHEDGTTTAFDRSLDDTATAFEAQYPGSGAQYRAFVEKTGAIHRNVQPLTFHSHPGVLDGLRNGSLGSVPFMLSSLGGVLEKSELPAPVRAGIGIWTHIAGQPMAPAPMAFVPSLFHGMGTYLPRGGMRAGVEIRYGTKVAAIEADRGRTAGGQTAAGEFLPVRAVVSDASGIGTYVELVEDYPEYEKEKLRQLSLQSPGTCVYLAVRGRQPPYYVRFKLRGTGCTAFVQPGLLDPELAQDGWYPARLISPLAHAEATRLGAEGQHRLMDEQLAEPWWQEGIDDYRVLHRRTTFEWGRDYNLYRDSMNPVMTAQLMRKGRLAHRSPSIKNLYLTGSSTHPGQWVSSCAIAGILAADCLNHDHPAHA
jgi:phytoene dehydrogenase-like protein